MCSGLQQSNPEIQCKSVPQPSPTAGKTPHRDGDDDNEGGNSGLSTNAKIGIGLAVGLGVPLLLLFAFLLYRYRTRPARTDGNTSAMDQEIFAKRGSISEATTSSAHFSKMTSSTIPEDELPRPVSAKLSFGDLRFSAWDVPERRQEHFEMGEQQRMRHEMDARSLPDIDLDGGERRDRRSLEDIERSRNSGPHIGMALGDPGPRHGHGPVSPIEGQWF